MLRRRPFSLAVLALATPLGGCYTYASAPSIVGAPPGADVHVQIEPAASNLIAAAVGPRVQTLDGRAVAADDSTLTVSVRTITRTLGSEENWNGDAVRIPRSAVAQVQVRRFDALKTTLIVGGIVGAAIAAGHAGTSGSTAVIQQGGSRGQQ